MSISTPASRNDYVGNSSTAVYAYGFYIFLASDLLVTVRKISDGTETTLAITTDYTVSGAGARTGGNVTLVNAAQAWLDGSGNLITGYDITIRRSRPLTQTTDLRNQGSYFPETVEDTFDACVMIDQQQQDQINRSVKLPETVAASGFDTGLPANIATSAGYAIVVNGTGNGFSLSPVGVDVTLTARVFGKDTFANLKAAAAAAPTLQRRGWATDIRQLVEYVADVTVGDEGWIILGGG